MKTKGAGKYTNELTSVRQATQADGALLIILNGNKGHGLSLQLEPHLAPVFADMLEGLAKEIRNDYKVEDSKH